MFRIFKRNKKYIKVIQPKPFQEIGARFVVTGWVSSEWLKSQFGMDYRIFLDYIDINGQTFLGSSFDVKRGLLSKFTNRYYFSTILGFTQFNVNFIQKSQGRITIKLGGQDKHEIYIPLVVKQLEPKGGADPEIVNKHGKIEKTINQYEKDLLEWEKEMEILRLGNPNKVNVTETDDWLTEVDIDDDELLKKLLRILSISSSDFEEKYKIAKQAQAERQLSEKYKEAIKWRGPLLRGTVKRWRGFIFKVHSDDHGKHFHAVHAEKSIDARISFPEIEIIDYKLKKKNITTKEEKAIKNLFKNTALFTKLENEFKKREEVIAQ